MGKRKRIDGCRAGEKLSDWEIAQIKEMAKNRIPQRDIAKALSRGYSTISAVLNGDKKAVKEGCFNPYERMF